MPLANRLLSLSTSARAMPIKMANTGPPTTGNFWPKSQDGIAMTRDSPSPGSSALIFSTGKTSLFLILPRTLPGSMDSIPYPVNKIKLELFIFK